MKEGWEYKTIGDIAFFQSGSRPKGGVSTIKEGVLSLGGEHIGKNGYVSIATPKYVTIDFYTNNPKGHIEENDILLCKDGALTGKVAIVRKELQGCKAMINEHVFIIRTKHLLQKYLYYFLFSSKGQIQLKSRISGAAQGGLNGANFKTISVPYPLEKDEQQRIVEELDLLSGIIEKKKAQLKELDSLAQSIFYDMFGDPVTNEKGWEVKKLENIIKVIGGYAFKSTNFKEKGIPVLRIGNINSGEFKNSSMVFWERDDKLHKYLMHPGDLVMSLTGTVGKSDYGNICILDNSYKEYYLNQRNAQLKLKENVDKYYLSSILRFDIVKSKLTDVSRGVRQANISNKDIENLQIPLPPLSLQQQFAEKVEAIEHQKELIKQSIKEVETLFNSRMDYYFDG